MTDEHNRTPSPEALKPDEMGGGSSSRDQLSAGHHTPAPWTAEFDEVPYAEFGGDLTWTVNDAEGGSVCTLDGPKDEREAAARLIAAAPDLLEALRELIEEANRLGPQLPYNAPTQDIGEAIANARAAIAKATAPSSATPAERDKSRDELAALRSRVEVLTGALRPFAAIVPSSFYAADGSEAEGYAVMTWEHDRLGHQTAPDFTGADLAAARSALSNTSMGCREKEEGLPELPYVAGRAAGGCG